MDRYIAMAVAWRESTPVEIMSTEEILEETLRILREERASALQSEEQGMTVDKGKVYGEDNSTFCGRENWE